MMEGRDTLSLFFNSKIQKRENESRQMEMVVLNLDMSYYKATVTWRFNHKKRTRLCKTLILKNPNTIFVPFSSSSSSSSSIHPSSPLHCKSKSHQHSRHLKSPNAEDPFINGNQSLKTLLGKLRKKESDPLQILKDDDNGDWTKHQFWAVITFLIQASRSKEALQVFDFWTNVEKSRITEFNYEKIIGVLVEEGLMEHAVSAFGEMKSYSLIPSLEIYNSLIHGFARKGMFEDSLFYLKEMEYNDLKPDTETYDGLIEAYGKYKMYDEMGQCVKKMESDGCLPDHITYNLLIREFSRAGLLKRMERMYQTLISKRMDLQSSTLVAMLEAYANFGILDKMEMIYKRSLNLKTPLKEDLFRKLARFYVENYMFSRLDELGLDLSSKTGSTDLVWCLRLLSHACLLSGKGMNSILVEMESENVPWNVTIANIVLLAYLKMRDLKHLKTVLLELPARYVKPDIVTVGILFDAFRIGFDAKWVLITWRKMGLMDEAVEMNTDDLVLTAFGKGRFLRSCEEMYNSFEHKAVGKKVWTYHQLIDLVFEHNKKVSAVYGN